MKKLIIVKYAEDIFPNGKAPLSAAVHPDSYSAKHCGITEDYFLDEEPALAALEKLRQFNGTVNYGIVEAISDSEMEEISGELLDKQRLKNNEI